MPYRNDKPERFTRTPQPSDLINELPTPGRLPLTRRVPGETDVDTDPRFNLVGARNGTPAPGGELSAVTQIARRMAERHLPDRMGGCRHCGRTYCDLFLEALAVLDRRDQAAARRIRTVLRHAGLTPPQDPFEEPPTTGV
ncbi:hypothetical protein [Micromonospora sp. LOL_023]|uniref:hypothetical protein n=1 Tax=Micromonospora sp. LOL_023 TaxID=3345418 RepID=UPI003A867F9D